MVSKKRINKKLIKNNEVIEPTTMPKPTAISLFAGMGGDSLGMKRAGFDVIAFNEISKPGHREPSAEFRRVRAHCRRHALRSGRGGRRREQGANEGACEGRQEAPQREGEERHQYSVYSRRGICEIQGPCGPGVCRSPVSGVQQRRQEAPRRSEEHPLSRVRARL